LARWDYQPQREVLLERLAKGSRPTLLQLSAQGLATVGEERAIADLTRLAKGAAGSSAAIRDGSGRQSCAAWRRCACKAAA